MVQSITFPFVLLLRESVVVNVISEHLSGFSLFLSNRNVCVNLHYQRVKVHDNVVSFCTAID